MPASIRLQQDHLITRRVRSMLDAAPLPSGLSSAQVHEGVDDDVIGYGMHGSVVRMARIDATAELVAVKLRRTDDAGAAAAAAPFGMRLVHENVVRVRQIVKTETISFEVLELAKGGELFDKIIENEYFSEKESAKIFK